MSCIAGIINLDGQPVDRALLERMTGAMASRAPDGISIWTSGPVGLGHAMLKFFPGSENETQPCTLDGAVWISADARIDGRAELIAALLAKGQQPKPDAADAVLIMSAYLAFGQDFLSHLVGDFAFALWDERNRKLICARDHLGIRPLFYARLKNALLFASDLDALQVHPEISSELDEGFIADFLIFGVCMEAELSVYRQIRRLPPAHRLTLDNSQLSIARYWSLPADTGQPSREERPAFYRERFQQLFSQAVRDRVRAPMVAIELSGGMDSGAIAAELATLDRIRLGILAYSNTSPDLVPADPEDRFAKLTAAYLDIPVRFQAWEGQVFSRCEDIALQTAEPCSSPDLSKIYDQAVHMRSHGARVLLTGQMGDALFAGSVTYYRTLLSGRMFFRIAREMARSAWLRKSFRGLGLKSLIAGPKGEAPWRAQMPGWVLPDFARRVDFDDRWARCWDAWNSAIGTRGQFQAAWLAPMLDGYGALKLPYDVRHPFCDVRLLEFMLTVPNAELLEKQIMRRAMRNKLPEAVRIRPKTPLSGDPYRPRLLHSGFREQVGDRLKRVDQRFIDSRLYLEEFDRYSTGVGLETSWSSGQLMTPVALDCWLQRFE